jgi:hypothetical protein
MPFGMLPERGACCLILGEGRRISVVALASLV